MQGGDVSGRRMNNDNNLSSPQKNKNKIKRSTAAAWLLRLVGITT